MKIKYHGLLSTGLICTAIIVAGAYTWSAEWETTGEARIGHLKPLPAISVPGPAVMKEVELLSKRMNGLAYPPQSDPAGVNLLLFGYEPVKEKRVAAHGRQTVAPGRIGYSLTFTFFSDRKRFCIIDGLFYSEGGKLPGGGKILKIRPGRVLITRQESSAWVPLDETAVKVVSEGHKK